MFSTVNFKYLTRIISILLIFTVGLIWFQPDACAQNMRSEERLSQIDLVHYGHNHQPEDYTSDLETLSKVCSTSPDYIAILLEKDNDYIFKRGEKNDNRYMLRSAASATEGIENISEIGMSCEALFPNAGIK
jgi:hypothetical protein